MIGNERIENILDAVAKELPEGERNKYYANHYDRYLFTLQALCEFLGNQIPDGYRVLDVGCLPGHLSMALAKMGCDVYGLSCEVEYNSSIFKTPDIRSIKECNIETEPFPFEDSTFDLVIFTETIEHLPWSPLPALREIHRVLKKGGYLVLTTPNDSYIGRRISRIKNSLLFRSSFSNLSVLKERLELLSVYATHHLKYTMREIKVVLGWTDFDIMKEEHFPSSSGVGKIKAIYIPVKIFIALIARLFPQFRLYLLVIAKRP